MDLESELCVQMYVRTFQVIRNCTCVGLSVEQMDQIAQACAHAALQITAIVDPPEKMQ
jgi:hypothetical protein